jgi:hypothetical protein
MPGRAADGDLCYFRSRRSLGILLKAPGCPMMRKRPRSRIRGRTSALSGNPGTARSWPASPSSPRSAPWGTPSRIGGAESMRRGCGKGRRQGPYGNPCRRSGDFGFIAETVPRQVDQQGAAVLVQPSMKKDVARARSCADPETTGSKNPWRSCWGARFSSNFAGRRPRKTGHGKRWPVPREWHTANSWQRRKPTLMARHFCDHLELVPHKLV